MLILPAERMLIKPSGRIVLNKDSPQAAGLVAWYPFGAGLNAIDEGPIGRYHLADVGSPAFVYDKERGRVTDLATASSQRFNAAITPVTSYGCTLTCWHMKDNATDVTFLVQLYNSADTGQFMALMARASQEMRARKDGGTGSAQNADDSPGYTVGEWSFGAAVFVSATSMRVKANKRASVSNSTDTGTMAVDGISIGAEMFTTPRSYYGGLVDDVRVYNRALGDAELEEIYDPNKRFDLYYEVGRVFYSFPHPAGNLTADAGIASSTGSGLNATVAGTGTAAAAATIAAATVSALNASATGTGTAAAAATIAAATATALDASASGTGTAAASASIAVVSTLSLDSTSQGTGTASASGLIASLTAEALNASTSSTLFASATMAGSQCDALNASASGTGIGSASSTIAAATVTALDASAGGSGTQNASATIATATAIGLDATAAATGSAFANAVIAAVTSTALNATVAATGSAPAAAGIASAASSALNATSVGVGTAIAVAAVAQCTATALAATVNTLRTIHRLDFVFQRTIVVDFVLELKHTMRFEM